MQLVTANLWGRMFRILNILILSLLISFHAFASVDCDGTDDYFEDATTTGLPTGAPVSVGFWFKPDSVTGTRKIIAHGERTGTAKGWSFGTSGDEAFFTTHGVKDYITTSFTIVTGEWQFLGAYLDTAHDVYFYHWRPSTGTLSTASVLHGVGMVNPGTGPITICANDNTTTGTKTTFYDGQVDDIFMINRAMTQADFEAIFRSKLREMPIQIGVGDLDMYYKLDDKSDGTLLNGVTVKDYSQNANDVVGSDGGSTLTAKAGEVLSYP